MQILCKRKQDLSHDEIRAMELLFEQVDSGLPVSHIRDKHLKFKNLDHYLAFEGGKLFGMQS